MTELSSEGWSPSESWLIVMIYCLFLGCFELKMSIGFTFSGLSISLSVSSIIVHEIAQLAVPKTLQSTGVIGRYLCCLLVVGTSGFFGILASTSATLEIFCLDTILGKSYSSTWGNLPVTLIECLSHSVHAFVYSCRSSSF